MKHFAYKALLFLVAFVPALLFAHWMLPNDGTLFGLRWIEQTALMLAFFIPFDIAVIVIEDRLRKSS